MANFTQAEKTFTLDKFLGVNESPDGDTGLKFGEANAIRNWRITADGNLQVRPGQHTMLTAAAGHPIRAFWHGYVDGMERTILVCNGHAYTVDTSAWTKTDLGTLTDAATFVFGYSEKLYFLNGHEFKCWDGTNFGDVTGYRPLIAIACAPANGAGTLVDSVNKLNGLRRLKYSGTASTTIYQLPETAITSVDKVISNGTTLAITTGYTQDLTAGTVTFITAPGAGTNNVEIWYTKGTGDRATILAQRFAETYNGGTDNRVFLYGDGTNVCYYSGLDYDTGLPTAEYFPDLNVIHVDTANTPITSMIRHGNSLVAFKTDSTYVITYDIVSLPDNTVTTGFMVKPIRRDVGNEAYGQVQIVNNDLLSLYAKAVWDWKSSYVSSTRNERSAERLSAKIQSTLRTFTLKNAKTFDDQENSEYWIVNTDGKCAIYNYLRDAWYTYTNINASCFLRLNGELYIGTKAGTIEHFSRSYYNDNGTAINAVYEGGSFAFDRETWEKSINYVYLCMKPESGSRVYFNLLTDKAGAYTLVDVPIVESLTTFVHMSFAHFSFNTNRRPKTTRIKFKANRFIYAKFTLTMNESASTATITSISIPVIYTGKAR